MRYKEAYAYINSFTNYEQMPGINYAANMDNLERVRLLMKLLGNPQDSFKAIVIAGTKGKGSVAAMLDAILREAGYKTGLYTSPHLHTFRERIRVGGAMIPAEDMARLTERVQIAVEAIEREAEPQMLPTTYELTTALGFLYFQEQKIDIAVLEVGLGGRLDAVNVVQPVVSVITSISLDHTQVLGNTLALIAAEKAGIIKEKTPVVTAPQLDEPMKVILKAASRKHAPLTAVGREIYVSTGQLPGAVLDDDGIPVHQAFTIGYRKKGEEEDTRLRLRLKLLGSHQQVNASVALATLQVASNSGINVGEQALLRGFAGVQWPGRLEIVSREPLVVVDGAHNADSMAKLVDAMNDLFYGRGLVVVLASSRDKDIEGMVRELGTGSGNVLGPKIERVIVTRSHHARAAEPKVVAGLVRANGLDAEVRVDPEKAFKRAETLARKSGVAPELAPVVLVTGSLFIVAEAREHYGLAPDLSEED